MGTEGLLRRVCARKCASQLLCLVVEPGASVYDEVRAWDVGSAGEARDELHRMLSEDELRDAVRGAGWRRKRDLGEVARDRG